MDKKVVMIFVGTNKEFKKYIETFKVNYNKKEGKINEMSRL